MKIRVAVIVFSLGLAAAAARADSPALIPLIPGLGSHTRPVVTSSPEAQKYFDQGVNFLFGFNHGAAIRSFKEAARLDPECAMAHWGIALANGPHINFPMMLPPMIEEAWAELQLAQKYASTANPADQALIAALATRYANPQPEDRSALDLAYANAMREVWKKFPKDPDVGVFFAEAMMDLRPWDQWTPEGEPEPGTDEILATLDAVLALDINHPFANHLYIHATEASAHPERAVACADRLRTLQPGLAHNVHMPSHVYIRVGRWQDAVDANIAAVAADKAYRKLAGPAKGILLGYIAHNQHMLAYAAMMSGQHDLAVKHIREMVDDLPPEFLQEWGPFAEAFLAMPLEVFVRFGDWDAILAEPIHPPEEPFSRAFQFAARGIALAAKGDTAAAREEQAKYFEAAKAVAPDRLNGNNSCQATLAVVTPMLEGEILVREGKIDEGIATLKAAVAEEDKLKYDEPPGWLIPVRHSLGAVLMLHGRYAEAEEIYREDLKRLPMNGWSLFGLSEALTMEHKAPEAAQVRQEFETIWKNADLQIHSSCLCQPGI